MTTNPARPLASAAMRHRFTLTALAATAAITAGAGLSASAAQATPFPNCAAAYAAGRANIPAGDPQYGKHLDADGDGKACDKPPAGWTPGGHDHDTTTTTTASTTTSTERVSPSTTVTPKTPKAPAAVQARPRFTG